MSRPRRPRRALPALLLALAACAGPRPVPVQSEGTLRAPDGVELAYDDRGDGEPTLVLVHGWACDRRQWDAVADDLARDHRVVALDLAGHGESGAGRDEWSLEGLAGDVVAVLEALDLRAVVLVGHSMGAPVSLLAAARAPERVVGVVGVDSLHDADLVLSPDMIAPLLALYVDDYESTLRSMIADSWPRGTDPRAYEPVVATAAATDPEVSLALLRSFVGFGPGAALAACPVPVVCVQGTINMATDLEANRERDPDFEAITLEGRGHWPQLEAPREFEAALRDALARIAERDAR